MLLPEVPLTAASLQAEAEKDNAHQWQHVRRLSLISFLYANLFREKLVALAAKPQESQDMRLKTTLLNHRTMLGPFNINMMDTALTWLDQGIRKVVVDAESLNDRDLAATAEAVSVLPPSRVLLRVPVDQASIVAVEEAVRSPRSRDAHFPDLLAQKLLGLKEVTSGVVLALRAPASHLAEAAFDAEFDRLHAALRVVRQALQDEAFVIAVEWVAAKQESFDRSVVIPRIAALHETGVHVLAPALPEVTEEQRMRHIDASKAFVSCLRSDRSDGLFTTVVTDESGVALGLVYSSVESVLAALTSGRGVYYSRSRKGLWKKGESSGNIQVLLQVDIDCDSDALRFMVRQEGAGFCHLNTRTCWGEDGGLRALQSLLQSRLEDAPAGSYTKRLFNDPELLRNKLVEEAQELAEAQTTTHVAEEAADVMYFAMVRCVAAGATLEDIEKQLDKRSLKVKRRPGNAKAYRIDAAAEILNKRQKK